jgi:hypothetical protein
MLLFGQWFLVDYLVKQANGWLRVHLLDNCL